jgi:hypothetical protein
MVENRNLETGRGVGEATNKGFAPYVAKGKIAATY